MEVFAGEIVFSKAGRDKERPFVVLEVIDTQYVLLADGRLRRVDQPKKKKIKHLLKSGHVAQDIQEKLSAGMKVTNPDLKRALTAFLGDCDA
ncbi:MAG: KOW domain-containing RNA-binding protein [Clostridia bacterium]|nr:KOW domain-containing RNA-binding protein [Clostridia bacterium]